MSVHPVEKISRSWIDERDAVELVASVEREETNKESTTNTNR